MTEPIRGFIQKLPKQSKSIIRNMNSNGFTDKIKSASLAKFVKERLIEQPDSEIRKINEIAGEMNAVRQSEFFTKVPNLSMGIPNFPPSAELIKEISKRLSEVAKSSDDERTKYFSYQNPRGSIATQDKIAEFYKREYPDSELSSENSMIFNGATQFSSLMFDSLNSDLNGSKAKIALFVPYFPIQKDQIQMSGKEQVSIIIKDGETPAQALSRNIDNNLDKNGNNTISALLLSYPNNPTGNYYSKEELSDIMSVVGQQGNMMLGVEKLYDKIAKDPNDIVFPLHIDPKYHEKVPYMESTALSKSYSMPGSHIAYGFASKELMQVLPNIAFKTINCPSAEVENTLRTVLDFEISGGLDNWKNDMCNHYLERVAAFSDKLPEGFSKHPSVNSDRQGSFYVTVGAPDWIGKEIPDNATHSNGDNDRKITAIREKIGKDKFTSGKDITDFLLYSESAAVVSLNNFGLDEPYFRVSCAVDIEDIKRAKDSMESCNKAVIEGKDVFINSSKEAENSKKRTIDSNTTEASSSQWTNNFKKQTAGRSL